MKQIYIAASWVEQREEAKALAADLELMDQHVKSSWLYVHDGNSERYLREQAYTDVSEVRECDVLVRLADGVVSGGKMFETGLAYALGKVIYVVGGKQMIFDHLPNIIHVKDKEHLKRELCPHWIN